jgi:hypothetical protein
MLALGCPSPGRAFGTAADSTVHILKQGMNFYRLCLLLVLLLWASATGAETEPALQFEEVYRLIRTNLLDISESELSRIAALGFLKELGNKAQLGPAAETNQAGDKTITRKAIYNDSYGYIRVARVASSLPVGFQEAFKALSSTNRLKGLVIDLRFASGSDYESAARTADLFLKTARPLLKIGGNEIRSTEKSSPIKVPVAILVNERTSGAAEALAAILRDTEAGLVIGAPTAGEARLFETFNLSTGQQLRLGTIPVLLPNGEPLPAKGLAPDIRVAVAPPEEKLYYDDPFVSLRPALGAAAGANDLAAGTNRLRRFSEADLVRRHREGIDIDPDAVAIPDTERQVVMDPALARGLDFLKGLSVLQQFRPL